MHYLFFQVYIISVIMVCVFAKTANSQAIRTIAPGETTVTIAWQPNPEPDLDHYVIYIAREDTQYSTPTPDTLVQAIFPRAWQDDSLFCFVTAVDTAGNESQPSEKIVFVPAVIALDFKKDKNCRVDVEDLRVFLKNYNYHFGQTIWKKTE